MAEKWYQMKERAAGEKRLLFMWYVYKFLGKSPVKFLTFFVALCAFCAAKPVREYSKNNLSVIAKYCKKNNLKQTKPDLINSFKNVLNYATKPDLINSFKNVLNYAYSLVDNMEIFAGDLDVKKIFFDKPEDEEIFYDDIRARKGIFFICSHTGNVNVLRMFFKNKDPMMRSDVNVFLSEGKKKMQNTVSLYPVEEISIETSIELKEKLETGEIAFMAGDRLSSGTSNLTFKHLFFDKEVEFPVGTFKLAQLMETPVYFICALKDKNDTYKIYLKRFETVGTKKETLLKMQKEYVEFVEQITTLDPLQFYHFYQLFE